MFRVNHHHQGVYYLSLLKLLLLLLLVFSPWAGLGRDQISVSRLV